MGFLYSAVLLFFSLAQSAAISASQSSQTQQASASTLTNADVLDMLKSGLSQEIVVAKIRSSTCDFDTSPAALKALKAASVPDPIILAMVEASVPGTPEWRNDEASVPGQVACNHGDPIPVFPPDEVPIGGTGTHRATFYAKCGDRIRLLGPTDETQSWLKMRDESGRVGYIASAVVTKLRTTTEASQQETSAKKRQDMQKANDDLDDCKVRFQDDYDARMNALATLSLTPTMRAYAAARLKRNLDAELRQCRAQYESQMKTIESR